MINKSIIGLILLLSSLCGCLEKIPEVKNPLENQNGNFILYVSNQSYENKTVDILVKIDNTPVLHEYFKVKNQHNWKKFSLQLPDGKHKIEAITQNGNAAIVQQFDVKGKNWAVLDYWYSKKEGHQDKKPSFTFEVSDKPIGFL